MLGPEQEKTELTRAERHLWRAFLTLEVRLDSVGFTCRARLVELLDQVSARGGLCDCPDHVEGREEGLDDVQAFLWNPAG